MNWYAKLWRFCSERGLIFRSDIQYDAFRQKLMLRIVIDDYVTYNSLDRRDMLLGNEFLDAITDRMFQEIAKLFYVRLTENAGVADELVR